ncbi:hypothetical protein [Methylobacterium nigriterrae]|uniref:hypothetical protein n=1 Tax=Methylobacterium nigriterrae TaxID=3127512 RepID=UPI003013D6C2
MDQFFYRRTTEEKADSILRHGFRDEEAPYLIGINAKGVWLSDRPVDCNEGATGDTLLRVILPCSVDISEHYFDEGGEKGYKEWLVPASILNSFGRAERYSDAAYHEDHPEGFPCSPDIIRA